MGNDRLKIKIVYVTGSRSDFGRMKYILNEIDNHSKYSLSLIVTGMHLSKEFGYTINEIKEKFPKIPMFIVDSLFSNDTLGAMSKSFGICIYSITQYFESMNPDIIIILGDRWEGLAGAFSAQMLNKPVVHIGGGYRSGSIDDRLRDAISVFSDLHLVANKNCAKRVISLGIQRNKVHCVGAPDLEAITKRDFTLKDKIIKKYKINKNEPLVLAVFHPDTKEYINIEKQTKIFINAIIKAGHPTILVYPNADAGGKKIIQIIKSKIEHNNKIKVFENLGYEDFLGIMNIANVIVGNSSAGIIEAPSFGLPAINIGNRQQNREKGKNVLDIDFDSKAIIELMDKVISDNNFKRKLISAKNPYGDGNTSKKVIKILDEYIQERKFVES